MWRILVHLSETCLARWSSAGCACSLSLCDGDIYLVLNPTETLIRTPPFSTHVLQIASVAASASRFWWCHYSFLFSVITVLAENWKWPKKGIFGRNFLVAKNWCISTLYQTRCLTHLRSKCIFLEETASPCLEESSRLQSMLGVKVTGHEAIRWLSRCQWSRFNLWQTREPRLPAQIPFRRLRKQTALLSVWMTDDKYLSLTGQDSFQHSEVYLMSSFLECWQQPVQYQKLPWALNQLLVNLENQCDNTITCIQHISYRQGYFFFFISYLLKKRKEKKYFSDVVSLNYFSPLWYQLMLSYTTESPISHIYNKL